MSDGPQKKGVKKSTKKFQKNRLADSIKQRRVVQKFARKDQEREEKREKRIAEAKAAEDDAQRKTAQGKAKADTARNSTDVAAGMGVGAAAAAAAAAGDDMTAEERAKAEDLDFDTFLQSGMLDDDAEADADADAATDDVDESRLLDGLDADAKAGAAGAAPKLAYDIGADADDDDDDTEEKLAADEKAMSDAMAGLEQKDPAFFEHLKKSDGGLLSFEPKTDDVDADDADADADGDDSMGQPKKLTKKEKKRAAKEAAAKATAEGKDGADADADGEGADGAAAAGKKTKRQKEKERAAKGVTSSALKALSKHIVNNKSLTALRRMLALFRQGCHLGDEQDNKTEKPKSGLGNAKTFQEVMRYCLSNTITIFDMHLKRVPTDAPDATADDDSGASGRSKNVKSYSGWDSIAPLVRSYLGNLMHFLGSSVDTKMLAFVLKSAEAAIPYFEPFPKLSSKFAKVLLKLWGGGEYQSRTLR